MKIIVYPGSFDPLHYGHLLIADQAQKAVKADKVLFLLSPSTVWKKVNTTFEHRANMIKAAISDNPLYELSLLEASNEGKTNFTYLSLEALKNIYPSDELYLLLGEDQASSFDKWINPELIAELATILVYKRRGSRLNKALIDKYHMVIVRGLKSPTSSTKVRHGESIDVPSPVLDYMGNHKLYYFLEVSKKLSDKRYFHSLEVAKLSRLIAIANQMNPLQAFLAGLYHDIGKEVPETKTKAIMEQHYHSFLDIPEFAFHQFVGEYVAKHEYFIRDKKILGAIKYHATGNKKMSTLARLVYAADKIEPTRGFDSSDLIAAMIKDLDTGFVTVLAANKEHLSKTKHDTENRLTKACFNYYLK